MIPSDLWPNCLLNIIISPFFGVSACIIFQKPDKCGFAGRGCTWKLCGILRRTASLRCAGTIRPHPQPCPSKEIGRCPLRFCDNISKSPRSSYINLSSIHTNTHSLTNKEFSRIMTGPCHYYDKESQHEADPSHHTSLNRLGGDWLHASRLWRAAGTAM